MGALTVVLFVTCKNDLTVLLFCICCLYSCLLVFLLLCFMLFLEFESYSCLWLFQLVCGRTVPLPLVCTMTESFTILFSKQWGKLHNFLKAK